MNTTIKNRRWTNKEITIAKETLKLTNGNQKNAAIILSTQLDRSLISIQVRLCSLAKKHPSLRKENIARRRMKIKPAPVEVPVEAPVVETVQEQTFETETVIKVKEFIIEGNKLIITF
jgi:hypothetical protein